MESQNVLAVLNALNKVAGSRHFCGVYPADMLPEKLRKPAAIVANTSPASQRVGHWVAFYIPRTGPPLYFDSFGTIPFHPEFYTWLEKNTSNRQLLFNKVRYQAEDSHVCGFYALIFLARRMGLAFATDHTFDKDFASNDVKISTAFQDMLKQLKM